MRASKDIDPPRLLFVAPNAAFFISHRLNLASAAMREGYKVGVACPSGPGVDEIEGVGAVHLPFPVVRRSTNPLRELGTLRSIAAAIRKLDADLVHLVTSKPILYGGSWCRLRGIPTVSAVSGLGYLFVTNSPWARMLRNLVKAGYRFALNGPKAHVIFQNQDDLKLFRAAGIVTHDRTILIPGSGTDLGRITPQELAPGRTVVLLPARMIRDKGVLEFIEAARILHSSGVEATFRLLGDPDPGNPTSLTEADLRRYEAEGIVEWRPHTADIEKALAAAHIIALPSFREGFPKTLIDAAAAGRAMVTTDVPGCRDAIVEGVTGFLCAARDARDLARVLRPLIADRDLQRQMGAAARVHAENNFDVEKVTSEHLKLYTTALSCPDHA